MSQKPNEHSGRIEMKKSRFIFLLLLLLFIGAVIGYILSNKSFESEFSSYEGYDNKFLEIPIPEANEMVNYYQENTTATSRAGSKLCNPKATYFPIGALAKYFGKLKVLKGATGVRIYFGRYKNIPERPEYKDCSTAIFVATRKNADGDIEDILTTEDEKAILYQPYNGGISCPPLPAASCKGQKLGTQ
jgi:hypothetical protein